MRDLAGADGAAGPGHVFHEERLPEPLAEQWPFANWDRGHIKVVAPEPGTPPGQVVLQIEFKGVRRTRWYCDPDHDFIAVRQVESSKEGDAWKVGEEKIGRQLARLTAPDQMGRLFKVARIAAPGLELP